MVLVLIRIWVLKFKMSDFFSIIFFCFQCIELLGAGCLPDEMMVDVLRILNKLLTEHFERATERHQKRNDEDYDEVNGKSVSLCYYK